MYDEERGTAEIVDITIKTSFYIFKDYHSCWDMDYYYLLVFDDKNKNDHVWNTHSVIKSPHQIGDKSMFSYHNNYGSILLSRPLHPGIIKPVKQITIF